MSAMNSSETDTLSAIFSALSDPTRRAMLVRLSQGEASVNELAAPFKMSLPAISKHIKVLEKAGLLSKTINAQQRPCKINGLKLQQASHWIKQFTTNSIATQQANTPATGEKLAKKSVEKKVETEKLEKLPKSPKKTNQLQEKSHDDIEPNDLQQQIGFDF